MDDGLAREDGTEVKVRGDGKEKSNVIAWLDGNVKRGKGRG